MEEYWQQAEIGFNELIFKKLGQNLVGYRFESEYWRKWNIKNIWNSWSLTYQCSSIIKKIVAIMKLNEVNVFDIHIMKFVIHIT